MSEARELPSGWTWAEISDVSLPGDTWNPRTSKVETFSYIDIEAVDNKQQRIVAPKKLLPAQAPSRARVAIKAGDVLFSLVRPYLKNIAVVPKELDGQVASTAFLAVRPAKGIDSSFIFYQLLQDSFINSIPTYGNSPPAARDDEFFKLKISLAPSDEQTRISGKIDELLSDLDAGVAALERARANLKRYRAAVLKAAVEGRLTAEWRKAHPAAEPADKLLERILAERRRKWEEAQLARFAAQGKQPPKGWKGKYPEPATPDATNLPKLPEGWCWATVDELVIEPACNGISVRGSDTPPGVAALRLNAMTDRGFDFSRRRYIPLSEDVAQDLAIIEGDFFVSRGNGSLHLVGRGTLATSPQELIVFPDTMIRLRFIAWGRIREYLARIWPSRFVRNQVEGKAKTSAGIYKISQSDLTQFIVSLPPIDEQEEIASSIDARLSVIEKVNEEIEQQLHRALHLRQSILKRAFEGKLVPQDPSDEPAAILLERIRAARAAQNPPRARKRRRAPA